MKNIALILAAGEGKRAETPCPKQFLLVKNKPLIVYTLEKFERCSVIDSICVITHKDWIDDVKTYADKYNVTKLQTVVVGGPTGLHSLKNGIDEISKKEKDALVLIHDAVRPFVSEKIIVDNIEVAKKNGVAVTSVPCVETLVKVEGSTNCSSQLIPRDGLMRVMTPQTFRLNDLKSILDAENLDDCLHPSFFSLYMSKGFPVTVSYGSEKNVKITYPEDVEFFKNLFV